MNRFRRLGAGTSSMMFGDKSSRWWAARTEANTDTLLYPTLGCLFCKLNLHQQSLHLCLSLLLQRTCFKGVTHSLALRNYGTESWYWFISLHWNSTWPTVFQKICWYTALSALSCILRTRIMKYTVICTDWLTYYITFY